MEWGVVEDSEYVTVPVAKLRVGATLRAPIYETRDNRNILLLTSGITITESVITKLRERGVSQIRVLRSELSNLTGALQPQGSTRGRSIRPTRSSDRGRRDDVMEANPPSTSAENGSESDRVKIRNHGAVSYNPDMEKRFERDYAAALVEVDLFFEALSSGRSPSAEALQSVSSDMLRNVAEDIDLFVATGIRPDSGKYPHQHCLRTAMLSMAMGAVIGLTESDLIELGLGCLCHDAGMLRIDAELYSSTRKLSDEEFREIKKHPLWALRLVKDIPNLPTGARIVIQQMHERMNGQGYPQREAGNRIHPLAQIAAVADVFVALVSERPYRPAFWPYYAAEQIVRDRGSGLFGETATRALLHSVSMFPIGSFVEVSDGRVGRVIRANGAAYKRPILELRDCENPTGDVQLVDLTATDSLRVVRPLKMLNVA